LFCEPYCSGATKKPVGILHVKVIRALNLLKMDLLGKSDPYVKMRLSGEKLPSKKTSVKMSNLNPEWNEHFRFIVKDPDTQVLELHMFDWEKVSCCIQTYRPSFLLRNILTVLILMSNRCFP
jgi:Ca2+-dependent lipid-binding protein